MIIFENTAFKTTSEGTLNENRNLDRASSTWADLCSAWAKWFFQFPQHGAYAIRIGRTIYRCTRTVSLLLGCRCATSRRRCAAAGESVRAPWSCAAWASNCEHTSVSPVPKSYGYRVGDRCSNPLVDCLLWTSSILLQHICATNVVASMDLFPQRFQRWLNGLSNLDTRQPNFGHGI